MQRFAEAFDARLAQIGNPLICETASVFEKSRVDCRRVISERKSIKSGISRCCRTNQWVLFRLAQFGKLDASMSLGAGKMGLSLGAAVGAEAEIALQWGDDLPMDTPTVFVVDDDPSK